MVNMSRLPGAKRVVGDTCGFERAARGEARRNWRTVWTTSLEELAEELGVQCDGQRCHEKATSRPTERYAPKLVKTILAGLRA